MANVLTQLGRKILGQRLKGTGTEPLHIGVGTGAGTAAAADTTLFTEVADGRVAGTSSLITTSTTDDTYEVVGTYTATAARAITNAGLFTASSGGDLFMKGDFAVVNLDTNDSLTLQMRTQFI